MTAYQLFVHSHTLSHDGEHFLNDKSRDVNEIMLTLMEERRAAGVTEIDEDQLFFEAVGGSKRRRIYGVGQADSVYYPEASSSSSVNQMDIDDRVTQRVSELRITIENEIRESFEERISDLQEQVAQQQAQRESFEERLQQQVAQRESFEERLQQQVAALLRQQNDKSNSASRD